jgi:membrane associated rhomboid family serine protease
MIPISDENPTLHTPWMTWLLIGITVAVWMIVQGAGLSLALPKSVCNYGLVPGELTHLARVGTTVPLGDGLGCAIDQEPINRFTPILSMFLHGSWGHLLGNMLFIFIIFFKVFAIPAWLVLLWWFGVQVLTGLPQLSSMRPDVSGGVAVWAHVGGFVAGVVLIKLFENRRLVAKRDAIREIEHPHHRYDLPRL